MGGRWRASLRAGVAGALAGAAAAVAAEAAEPMRVMALGDSLTLGSGSTHRGGYRAEFWQRLRSEGYEIDMVGGKADGPDTIDDRHQGYPGSRLFELSAVAVEKVRHYQPDVVLLLAGSDECGAPDFSARSFAANLEVLIDRVQSAKRGVRLLVSTLPPNRFGRNQERKLQANELLKRVVRERAGRGEPVRLVDSFSALDPDRDMLDAHHPNDAGYEKIGDAFADALLALLGRDVTG
jgi:lysophospholipase L1-like esterase